MPSIMILENDADVPPGHLASACDRAGVECRVVRLWDGDAIADDREWAGVVSLGGHMGAYDEEAHPFLVAEKAYLRRVVPEGVPTLGLCLGSQLLADALGGKAFLAARPEVVLAPVVLTEAGRADPAARHLDGDLLVFHQDTWTLPPGASLLAESAMYPQAFRAGSAIGIQPHPEATPEILDVWVGEEGARRIAAEAGTDPDVLAADYRSAAARTTSMADRFFNAWLDEVLARVAA